MRFVVIGVLFLLALGVLILIGLVEGGIPVLTIRELKAQGYTGECRIDDGLIHSIENELNPLKFTIRSEADSALLLSVETMRSPPANFKIGNKVSVKGVYDPRSQKFIAEEVITACPSRYEASEAPALTESPPSPSPGKGK